jgi:hypothetical protein
MRASVKEVLPGLLPAGEGEEGAAAAREAATEAAKAEEEEEEEEAEEGTAPAPELSAAPTLAALAPQSVRKKTGKAD